MLFHSPSEDDLRHLVPQYPFNEGFLSSDNFQYSVYPDGSMKSHHALDQISKWSIHLSNRMYQTRWSWLMSTHLYEKGIPDDEWFISPGQDGVSVEFFPHFEEEDFRIKAEFNYFTDIFYYKLFSAFDTMGHILNAMYGLEIPRVDFYKAVSKLEEVRPDLYQKLNTLTEREEFKKMRTLRHSSTHNELAGHIDTGLTRVSDTEYHFGFGQYTTSSEIIENINTSLSLFEQVLEAVRNQVSIDLASS